jgi:hypothetical protein
MFNDNQRTMQKPIPTSFGPRTTATEALGGKIYQGKSRSSQVVILVLV